MILLDHEYGMKNILMMFAFSIVAEQRLCSKWSTSNGSDGYSALNRLS